MFRAEGTLKVIGLARHAIEQKLDNMGYGVTVRSTRPAGRAHRQHRHLVRQGVAGFGGSLHAAEPLAAEQADHLQQRPSATEEFTPLQDDVVRFDGMHIALVVAESLEQATEAASLLKVTYQEAAPGLDLRCESQ